MIIRINKEEQLTLKFDGRELEILKHLSNLETTIGDASADDRFTKFEIQQFFRRIRELRS